MDDAHQAAGVGVGVVARRFPHQQATQALGVDELALGKDGAGAVVGVEHPAAGVVGVGCLGHGVPFLDRAGQGQGLVVHHAVLPGLVGAAAGARLAQAVGVAEAVAVEGHPDEQFRRRHAQAPPRPDRLLHRVRAPGGLAQVGVVARSRAAPPPIHEIVGHDVNLVHQGVNLAHRHLDFFGSRNHAHADAEALAQRRAQQFQQLNEVLRIFGVRRVAVQPIVLAVVRQVLPIQRHAIEQFGPPLEHRHDGVHHGLARLGRRHRLAEPSAPAPPAHGQLHVELLALLAQLVELPKVPKIFRGALPRVLGLHAAARERVVVVSPGIAAEHLAVRPDVEEGVRDVGDAVDGQVTHVEVAGVARPGGVVVNRLFARGAAVVRPGEL